MARIKAELAGMLLSTVRPSHVKAWTVRLRMEGKQGSDGTPGPPATSYVYACHARLAQIVSDAVHDGIIPRSPCSRRTSPGQGKQLPYVATTEQLWALYDGCRKGSASPS